jgi:hypothetical protein
MKEGNNMSKIKNTEKTGTVYIPSYSTFPLANTADTVPDSRVSIPSEDDTDEVKDWVDFKEM